MKSTIASIIIGISIITSIFILGNSYQNRNKKDDIISVTGLGSKDFTSDLIVWTGYVKENSLELKDAYDKLEKNVVEIKNYLKSKDITDNELVFNAVNINEDYEYIYDDEGRSRRIFRGYTLNQNFTIESKNVERVEKVSREVTELINKGIQLSSFEPRYYYTKLSELKLQMVEEATADAKARAEKIATAAGSKLGELQKAEMGVFQITGQNSDEEYSWGGNFNTTSKNKTASLTMKLNYSID
jgi:hypothetical protein